MAQDFERNFITNIGTTAQDIPDGSDFGSDNTIIGIHMANKTDNAITASCFMTMATNNTGNTGDLFTFTVTVAGSVFVLDGVTKPAITLLKGFTYVFDQSDSSNASHTLKFKTAAGGSVYTTGVSHTGTPGQAGAKTTIAVASDAPDSLYYYCDAHGDSMGNTIALTNAHYLIKDAPIPANSALQVLDGGAKLVVQSGDRMFFQSSTVTSLDVWVSRVDAIS